MNILITGANGQLGKELARQLAAGGSALGSLSAALAGAKVAGVDLPEYDLADMACVQKTMRTFAPDVVLNCAAFTNVDACETQTDGAFRANALLPRNLAIACEAAGAKLIHVSTDYVFPGSAAAPLDETAQPAPQSAYGRTKLLGESYVQAFCTRWCIVRTSWLYGHFGGNFVKTMQRVAKERGAVTVVDDQRGNPTNAEDLAHHLLLLAAGDEYGVFHCTGEGVCSWYDFAAEIIRLSGISATVAPCSTAEYAKNMKPGAAARPAYSALENRMLRLTVGNHMRPWQQALAQFVIEQKQNGELEEG